MRIGEVAKQQGVSTQTLRRWEQLGLIKSERTTLGQRRYTPEDVLEIQKIIQNRLLENGNRND